MNLNICVKLLFAFAISLFLFVSCSAEKPDAFGSYYSVYVFSDLENNSKLEMVFDGYAQKTIITPQREKVFRFFFRDSTVFGRNLERRNVIICGVPGERGYFNDMVRTMLSDDAIEKVEAGTASLFVKEDFWAKDQTLIIVAAPNWNFLLSSLVVDGETIADVLDDRITETLAHGILTYRYRTDEMALEKDIAREYGWFIPVPLSFRREAGDGESRFLWLRHVKPEQWIMVYNNELEAMPSFSDSVFIELRDSLTAEHYLGDVVDFVYEIEPLDTIDGLPARKIRGIYKNERFYLGGPFVSYWVVDSVNGQFYLLDGAVFAAGEEKEPYLRQVELALRKFTTTSDSVLTD